MKSIEEIQQQIRDFGTNDDMDTIIAGAELLAPLHEKEPFGKITVDRDIAYGEHERHVLDVYRPVIDNKEKRPVLLFLHGGSFVAGDKHRPGTPYNDNIGVWAARNGMVGVVMNYRLAPEHQFPAAAEDVNSALRWLYNNISNQNGDPEKIVAIGTSAGANLVATCIAHPSMENSRHIKAAILMSCIYDINHAERNSTLLAYFGEDETTYTEKSNLQGVINSEIPLMITLAEYETNQYEQQSLIFINAYFAKHGRWPNFYRIMNHNHYTSSQHINTADDVFGTQVKSFIEQALAE